jgi:Txe/YoeB family toxin of Txe-Axe toxin-antitoxin module
MTQRYAITFCCHGFETRVIWARTYKSLVKTLSRLTFKQISRLEVLDSKTGEMLFTRRLEDEEN